MEINKIKNRKKIGKTKKPKQFNNTDEPLDKVIRGTNREAANYKMRHVLSKEILKVQ